MTTVNTTNNTTSTTTSSSTTSLNANFQTFMTLLTAQLKAQDPLSPMDTSEFTNQLVQYSEVEQAMKTNTLLENLTSIMSNNSGSYAVGYLGKIATTSDPTSGITDGKATWDYNLSANAANVTLNIYDSNNKLVKSVQGDSTKGSHSFEWDGKTSSGTTVKDGTYTLKVVALDASGKAVTTSISRTGIVTAVDMSGEEPKAQIGGSYVTLSNITYLKQTDS